MSYVDSLGQELAAVGISGRLRRRIVLEIDDHLECNPNADLGQPRDLARQFADELGTARARRAALATFAALALAGVVFAISFLAAGPAGPGLPRLRPESAALAVLAAVLAVLGCQVAFVSGVAGALRAWRLRREAIVPRAEATVIGRRAAVAVIGGFAAMAGMALLAVEFSQVLGDWIVTFAVAGAAVGAGALAAATPAVVRASRLRPAAAGAAVGAGALAAATPAVVRASRLRPAAAGAAGDLFEDIGPVVPPVLHGRPWRFAIAVSAAVGLAIAIVGIAAGDPYDAIARGLADGLACMAGFALLGRYLGLR